MGFRFRLLPWFRLGDKEGLQTVKAALPCCAAAAEPGFREAEGGRHNAAGAYPADLLAAHQTAVLQDLEVLHNCRQAHREWSGKLGYRRRTVAQPDQDGPPRGVCERLEDGIQVGVRRIVKHILKYLPMVRKVNP